MNERTDPLLGWRLWGLRQDSLGSWSVQYRWGVGMNRAGCLGIEEKRCQRPPGPGCQCGFWGLFRPLECLRRARADQRARAVVIGLIRAWGEVAIHGNEGFRAEKAAVVCLFTDPVGDPLLLLGDGLPPPAPGTPTRLSQLKAVASKYGVPLLGLRDALDCGWLAELGIGRGARQEVEAWVRDQAA